MHAQVLAAANFADGCRLTACQLRLQCCESGRTIHDQQYYVVDCILTTGYVKYLQICSA